jgi:hypothetical protein
MPVPFAPSLERRMLPGPGNIKTAIRKAMGREDRHE